MVVGMVVYFSFPGYEYSIVYTFEYQTLDSWYKLHLVMMYHITLLIHYRNGLLKFWLEFSCLRMIGSALVCLGNINFIE